MSDTVAVDGVIGCRICRSTVGLRFAANGFDWFRCDTCRSTQKVLTDEQYRNLNPTYDPGLFLDSRNSKEVERFIGVASAMTVLSRAIDKYLGDAGVAGASRSFLDVGCGMGRYLIAAKRLGFEVLGFEPSTSHARVATQHFNLPVIEDYFSPDRVGRKTFDLIMLSHVIEHIYDPNTFIRNLVDVLRPGGVLIVITPNNESLVARTIGRSWPMLKPVDHVSMIGARAYKYFDLHNVAEVHHSTSEYPFEYVAALLSALKSSVVSAKKTHSVHEMRGSESRPPPLRGFGFQAKVLRCVLTVASAPMYLAAIITQRQACLTSIIVRRT